MTSAGHEASTTSRGHCMTTILLLNSLKDQILLLNNLAYLHISQEHAPPNLDTKEKYLIPFFPVEKT